MSHDPMCPSLGIGVLPVADLCRCSLIVRVRSDERSKTLDAARERIMRLPYEINEEILVDRDEVIGWIDALREEKK